MSDYFVRVDGMLAGRVMRFAGQPPSERWVAYSVATKETPGFPTRQAAADWLVEAAARAADAAKKEKGKP